MVFVFYFRYVDLNASPSSATLRRLTQFMFILSHNHPSTSVSPHASAVHFKKKKEKNVIF